MNSNKISTPIMNNPNQQQQQRYVPSRQINQPKPPQPQQISYDDEFGNEILPANNNNNLQVSLDENFILFF